MHPLERYSDQVRQDLRDWAAEHANSHERLVLLDDDPEKYPHQKISLHTIPGNPLAPEVVNNIALGVDARYGPISQATEANEKPLKIIGETLDSHQNVVLSTDHVELIDIALLAVKATSRLRQMGYAFDSAIIVNMMVKYLGVEMDGGVVPATELLALAFDEVYLTLPNTESAKMKIHFPKRALSAYNAIVMEHGIVKRLNASQKIGKAALISVASTGTVNKQLNSDAYVEQDESSVEIAEADLDRTIVIGRANTGMLKFTSRALTVVAATQMQDPIQVQMHDIPLSIRTQEKLDDAMRLIATMQNNADPSHHYVYDWAGDLPVIRQE